MMEFFRRIREFFKENPRMWFVVAAAILVATLFAWYAFRSTSVQVNQSSAAAQPPVFEINNAQPLKHGEQLSVSWSATNAVRCDAQGWFDTGSSNVGVDIKSAPINACPPTTQDNQVGINCTYADGQVGVAVKSFTIDTSTCPTATATPPPGGTSTPTPTPTQTSGPCTKGTDGLWYCGSLTCGLAGNNGAAPAGPATSIDVKQFRTVCNDVEVPNNPQVGCKIFMDATPKIGSQEGYPPKDPAWTCTGPAVIEETEGRYCYTPFAKASAPGTVTCCTNTGLSGDCVTFNVAAATSTTGGTTTTGGTPSPASLRISCGSSSNILTWNIPRNANSNTIQRMIPGGSWINVFTDASLKATTYTDTAPVAGAQYRHKSGANVASNIVSCSGSTGGVAVTQGPPVTCSPAFTSAKINEVITAQATGGTDVFSWNITQGGSIVSGGNEYIGVSYRTSGTKSLRVSSGGTSAVCTIDVGGSTTVASSPPSVTTSNGQLQVSKLARNVTSGDPSSHASVAVYPGQTAEFSIEIRNISAATVADVTVTDMVPQGMSFVSGSTYVDGARVYGDAVVSSGLSAGSLAPGAFVRVTWSAVADQTRSLMTGPNFSSPTVVVAPGSILADATEEVVAAAQVTVYGDGSSQQTASQVPTGPGDAVLIALLTAAALTLLYSGYTRSTTYLRREAIDIGNKKDPLDFRS